MEPTHRPHWARTLSDSDYALTERGYFSVEAAARYLQVSVRWVYQQIRKEAIRASRVGKGYRIAKAELDRILAGGEV